MGFAENQVGLAVDSYLSVLEQQGRWWGWKNQTGAGMLVPFGKWHAAPREAGKVTLPFVGAAHAFETGRRGSPDRVGVFRDDAGNGRFVAIELKTGINSQSEDQRYAERVITSLGGTYVLARDVRDVERVLVPRKRHEIPLDEEWAAPF